jgi:tetratricopeptide (TPR) repeat protein
MPARSVPEPSSTVDTPMLRPETNHRTARRALRAAIVALALGVAPAAHALDKADIMNLQAAGLSPDVIVQVIRSSVEPLTLSPADVDDLRVAGVAQPVLDEICLRINCAGQTAPGPVGPGGPSLEEEIRRQQELEAERIRLEQERMNTEREAMRQRIEAEQAMRATAQTAFTGLSDAERAHRAGNYLEAARRYQDYLANYAQPGSVEYYDSLAGFVRAMHARGYRHVIRSRALEAVLQGPTMPHFEEMFGILQDITNDVSYLDPRFEDMTSFTVGQYSADFQDEFHFFLGRFFWVYGESLRALEYFERVGDDSALRGKASYLSAVILLEQNENSRALGKLQEAVLSTERNGSDEDVAELAYLALARISYEIGQYDAALYYYQKVPEASFRHSRTLFEETWTYFMKLDWDRAIGALHSLHSPYYDRWFWPDLYVIEAATYLQVCDLDSAEAAIQAFYDTVTPIRDATDAYIADPSATPDTYWATVTSYYETLDTPEESPLPLEAVRWVVSDADYVTTAGRISQLEREDRMLGSDGAELGSWGETATNGLAVDLRTRQIEAGLQVAQMVRDFSTELTDWSIKVQEVAIEVSTERISMLGRVLAGGSTAGSAGSSAFVLAQDWQYWPFEGEYWLDEVGQYRGNLESLRDARGCTEPAVVEETGRRARR